MKKQVGKKENEISQKPAKKRVVYIDLLNILAIFAVVVLHQNGVVHTFADKSYWYSSLVFECLFYFAVPVFVMISGAMLMNYREKYDTKTFFKKRVLKVLIPAIFWIIIMIAWRVLILKNMTINDWSPKNLLSIVLSSKEEATYYFIFLILGLYLTMPVLSKLAKPEHKKTLWYIVGVYFIFNALLPNLLAMVGVSYNNDLSLLIGQWAMYAVLGYLLSTTEVPKKYRIMLYVLSAILIAYRYFTTVSLSLEAGKIMKTSWGYGQFHIIIYASAVFLFVKNLKLTWVKKHENVIKLLGQLAGCSFGVYLIHKIVMYYELKLFGVSNQSIWWRTLGGISTYAISVSIVYILKKIPLLKRIVP